MTVKTSDRCDRTSTVTIFYIKSSVRFIIILSSITCTTLRVVAELDKFQSQYNFARRSRAVAEHFICRGSEIESLATFLDEVITDFIRSWQ